MSYMDQPLGLGLRLAPSEGVGGPWLATLATLRALLETTDGADNPRSLAEDTGLATITTPSSKEVAYSKGFITASGGVLTDPSTWLARTYGGRPIWGSGQVANFKSATRTSGNLGGTNHAIYHSYRVRTNAPALYYSPRRNSSLAVHRVLVNGQYVSKTPFAVNADTNQKWVKIDLGSSTDRIIEVESASVGGLYGFWVEPAYTLEQPDETRPSVLFIGDSITATTDANVPVNGFGPVATDYLGVQRPILAGVGGQGFLADTDPSISDLGTFRDRLTADVTDTGPHDMIVVAGGFNDKNADPEDLEAEIALFFAQLRAENPAAVIVAVGPWDNKEGTAEEYDGAIPGTALSNVASARGDIFYIDPVGVEYTHPDGNHPDTAGHATLGVWLADEIRAVLAA